MRFDIGQSVVAQTLALSPFVVFPRHGVDVPVVLDLLRPDEPGLARVVGRNVRTPQIGGSAADRDEPSPLAILVAAEIQLFLVVVEARPCCPDSAWIGCDGGEVVLPKCCAREVGGGRGTANLDAPLQLLLDFAEHHAAWRYGE